jgi:thimet oligopeptidase
MTLARLSLSLHDREPAQADPIALLNDAKRKYLPMPIAEDAHMPASFTHLANGNYASGYYTYMWSLVIAKDLFSTFDTANLTDPVRAGRYRAAVLTPGGSKPATGLVEGLLGRPFTPAAWEAWLNASTR